MADNHVWEPNRKAMSELPSSDSVMDEKRKDLIRKAISFEIIDVRSYVGYRGDLLVEFTTNNTDTVTEVKRVAEAMGFEVVVRLDPLMIYQVFCISENKQIYDLGI